MLEMWKIMDPGTKCASYCTDTHRAETYAEILRNIASLAAAEQHVLVSVREELTLWRVVTSDGVTFWFNAEDLERVRLTMTLLKSAHEQAKRVEVSAREISGLKIVERK